MRASSWTVAAGLLSAITLTACGLAGSACTPPAAAAEPEIVWTRQFGSSARDDPSGMAVDLSGAVYVTGSTRGALPGQRHLGFWDAFLAKLGPEGTVRWIRQFGTPARDHAFAVAVSPSGAVYVVGSTTGRLPGQGSSGNGDAFIRKYGWDGSLRWTRQFARDNDEMARGVAVAASGDVYVVGDAHGIMPRSGGHGETASAWLRKVGPDGTLGWTLRFGSATHAAAMTVAVAPSGGAVVAGYEWGALPGAGRSGWDGFVRKYTPSGTLSWTRRLGTGDDDEARAVAVSGSGSVHLAGGTWATFPDQTSAGMSDAFVSSLGPRGARQWTHQFGTTGDDVATSVAIDPLGSVIVAGAIDQVTGDLGTHEPDAFVRAYGSDGAELWDIRFGTGRDDLASGTAVSAAGEIYVVGATDGTFPDQTGSGRSDIFVRRYSAAP
jgi:hypothetical protein